ncbi:uncharacterized protein LOC111025779 [Momordica charantia]|uniref:Uncharacterized protein LOC111025779 n=1 Tax=Momordica charantia TaxID=3673 RepID=A0A6J1DZM8_MOMCH|nr:uncharacterized protein LOC111025779 [Momordica charantia]
MDGTHTDYQTRWLDLDVVYLPYNIGGNHWIMVHIDLQDDEIIMWDLMRSMTPFPTLESELRLMTVVLSALMHRAGVQVLRQTLPYMPWRIHQVTSAPQQSGSGDCGMFCVKYFEYDVTRSNMTSLTQDNISFFREKLAIEMWANRSIF